jgi:hypothetical protein
MLSNHRRRHLGKRPAKRGWPSIDGLKGFEEKRMPMQKGHCTVSYSSSNVGIVATGLTAEEGRERIASLLQMNAAHGAELVPSDVSFGGVSGWKCRTWRNALCYVLFPGEDAVLMHVEATGDGVIDEAAIESRLHTLRVE